MRASTEKEKEKVKDILGRVDLLLDSNGMTKNKLTMILGKDHTNIYKWWSTTSYPSVFDLARIANFFNVTLDWLIDGKEDTLAKKYVIDEIEKFKKEIEDRFS